MPPPWPMGDIGSSFANLTRRRKLAKPAPATSLFGRREAGVLVVNPPALRSAEVTRAPTGPPSAIPAGTQEPGRYTFRRGSAPCALYQRAAPQTLVPVSGCTGRH